MEQIESYVLDSCALVAFFQSEDGGEKLISILKDKNSKKIMHAINLGEVYYDTLRRSKNVAKELIENIFLLPIEIIWNLDRELIETAGYYKVNHRMSYADSFVLATAHLNYATVISTDHHEFDDVEQNSDLEFFWLR